MLKDRPTQTNQALCDDNLLPMFPKQTALMKNTLAIHVATPIDSSLKMPRTSPSLCKPDAEPFAPPCRAINPRSNCAGVGEGTNAGLIPSKTAVPPMANRLETTKPGGDRSTRYHIAGFASAMVSESCNELCQGNLRMANAMPTKAPIALTTSSHPSRPLALSLLSLASFSATPSSSSAQNVSAQGSTSPRSTPPRPQQNRYVQLPLFNSTRTGASSRWSCKWVMSNA